LVAHVEGGTYAEIVLEFGGEGNIRPKRDEMITE